MAAVLLHIHRTVLCTDMLAMWSQAGTIEYETQSMYIVHSLERTILHNLLNYQAFLFAAIEEMIGASDSLSVEFQHKLEIQNTIQNYVTANCLAIPAAEIRT